MRINAVLLRVGAVVAILFGLTFLCVLYGSLSPAPDRGAYPNEGDFVPSPVKYKGELVTTGGRVVDTNPVALEISTKGGFQKVTIVGTSELPTVGQKVRVFGRLESDKTVRAKNVLIVENSGLWYTKYVSFVAGIWVLGRIIIHWKVVKTTATIIPRLGTGLLSLENEEESDNA
jgi:hypothetical protein